MLQNLCITFLGVLIGYFTCIFYTALTNQSEKIDQEEDQWNYK